MLWLREKVEPSEGKMNFLVVKISGEKSAYASSRRREMNIFKYTTAPCT